MLAAHPLLARRIPESAEFVCCGNPTIVGGFLVFRDAKKGPSKKAGASAHVWERQVPEGAKRVPWVAGPLGSWP